MVEDGHLKGGGVVGTVMSNAGLERYLSTLDLKLARAAVGDRYVMEEMQQRRLQCRRRTIGPHHSQRFLAPPATD